MQSEAQFRRPVNGAFTKFILVVLAGCVQAASVAWPFPFLLTLGQPVWWLQCLALAALVGVLRACTNLKQAWLWSHLFGTAWLATTFWWLFVSMHTYGSLNAGLSAGAVVVLAAAISIFYALGCAGFWVLSQARTPWASLAFAATWTLAEMARGTWFTGLGWGAVAYAHVDGPLASFAPWVGAYGVATIAAWIAATIAYPSSTLLRKGLAIATPLALALVLSGLKLSWTEDAGALTVTLLQGNIPQDEKFEPGSGVPLALEWYRAQLEANTSSLVVAPETAIPVVPQELPVGYWDALRGRFATGHQAALMGIPWGNSTQGYTNTVVGFQPGTEDVWRYDKHHLLPFGEFIPPLFKWFMQLMDIPLGDFNRGAVVQPPFVWQGQRLGATICYEDLFGEELGARFIDPQRAPTLFVNVSNLGWFGDTTAIDQHLQISRMRSLELERAFVRATNTGATVILDHHAQVIARLPRYTRGVLTGEVHGRTGATPYAWWVARFGLWPLWLLALACVIVVARKPRSRSEP